MHRAKATVLMGDLDASALPVFWIVTKIQCKGDKLRQERDVYRNGNLDALPRLARSGVRFDSERADSVCLTEIKPMPLLVELGKIVRPTAINRALLTELASCVCSN
jgi:hypothetical protein